MSTAPDPVELSAPRDPASYGRSRLMGPGFWALIAFGVLCILAGFGVSRFGPQLFPVKPQAPVASEAVPVGLPPASRPAPAEEVPFLSDQAPSPPTSEALARLTGRIEALEAEQSRTAEAAASALAAAALMEAAQTSRPFADELAALDAVSPPSADLRALRRIAERGAPSRAALAASFPDYAARAAGAARAPGSGAGIGERLAAALSRVVTLRQVGDVPGVGIDALLARAERQVEEGDLDHALKTLDGLPPAGRDAIAPWRAVAESRADIDRRISAVRVQALEDLARLARSGA